jgi:NAD+ diphosphatase
MEGSPFFAAWKHCPECAGPLRIEQSTAECRACGRRVYANPAPTASALVVDDDGRVLLARRAGNPGTGMWDLPGGFIEEGEDPVATLRRELEEEAGVEIEPIEFLGAFPDRYGENGVYTVNFYWTARILSGEPAPADDVADFGWFAPDELPQTGEFAFRNSVQALETWRGRVTTTTPRNR